MRTFQTKNGKRKKKIKEYMQYKLVFLFFAIALVFLILLGIMIFRVIVHGEEDTKTVLGQMNYSSTTIMAERGKILDCNLTPVAECETQYILILDPKVMLYNKDKQNNVDITLDALSAYFGLDRDELEQTVYNNSESSYIRYKGKLVYSYDEILPFLNYKEEINSGKGKEMVDGVETTIKERIRGVWFETEYKRVYPFHSLASKIIGFTGSDTSSGSWGIEQEYNDELCGTNGREYGYLNEQSNLERVTIPAIDGYNVVSTLDININRIISEQLQEWKKQYGGKSINILAMDPANGEVKAIVTDTDYDLNDADDLSAFLTPEELAALEGDENATIKKLNEIWRNGVISDTFEPGSTAKPLTMAAALEENLVDSTTGFHCDGYLMLAGYKIKCHNYDLGGCGDIDLAGALANSCNVAFMTMGAALGRTNFARYQQMFNLGQKTGIDLPGEVSAQNLLFTEEQLNLTELATSSFGQGFNVTMIQLASAYCSVINGGYYYQPRVVKALMDQNNQVIQEFEPVLIRQTVSEKTSELMREASLDVIQEGTGITMQLDGYQIGGKTGTAQKGRRSDEKYIISTITQAPYDDPKLVLYVVIDEPDAENQADSYPAQVLTNWIWRELCPYLGITSTASNDFVPEEEEPQEERKDLPHNEAWSGSIIEEPQEEQPQDQELENQLPEDGQQADQMP